MKKKVLIILALLLTTVGSVRAQSWTNIIVNSDLEGDDVSCFYVQEKSRPGTFLARITDGIGVNGSRAIKVQTTGEESAGYETQFDIRLPYELPAGTQYRLSFDYKSDKAAVRVDYYDDATDYSFGFQVSNEPGQYVWWTLGGWPAPYFETTEDNVNKWQHYEAEYTVPGDCNGSQSGDGDWLLNFQTIYIQLAKNKVATEFIIDNIKVEIDATVLAGLTEQPVTDPNLMILAPPYTVSLAEGTEDADKWTGKAGDATQFSALPLEGVEAGQTVTLQYSGTKRVKSVKAVVKGAAGL